jgi:hypothetical protein
MEAGHSFVWLKTRVGFEKRSVQTGSRNDLEAVVNSGLSEGDMIRRVAVEEQPGAGRQ